MMPVYTFDITKFDATIFFSLSAEIRYISIWLHYYYYYFNLYADFNVLYYWSARFFSVTCTYTNSIFVHTPSRGISIYFFLSILSGYTQILKRTKLFTENNKIVKLF